VRTTTNRRMKKVIVVPEKTVTETMNRSPSAGTMSAPPGTVTAGREHSSLVFYGIVLALALILILVLARSSLSRSTRRWAKDAAMNYKPNTGSDQATQRARQVFQQQTQQAAQNSILKSQQYAADQRRRSEQALQQANQQRIQEANRRFFKR
jgi:hypothetical protein